MHADVILVIDADPASLRFVVNTLQEEGYEVIAAGNAKEGLIAAWSKRPNIIIIDPRLPDMSPAELFAKLRKDRRTANTPLLAFSSLRSPRDVQATIKIGFDHYLAKESDSLPHLVSIIQKQLASLSSKDASTAARSALRRRNGQMIVFLSAKGGIGTSSLCANVANAFTQIHPQARVAVADLVLPIGSIAAMVGYQGSFNLVEASLMSSAETTVEFLDETLPETGLWQFQLLAGSPDPQSANLINIVRIPILLDTMLQTFDYVFVDLGRTLSRISLPIILDAHQAVLLLSPDQSAVTLTQLVWDYLKSQGLQKFQVYPLFNRAVGLDGLSRPEIEKLLDLEITGAIPHAGGDITMANNQHVPISYKFPDSTAAFAIRQAAINIETRAQQANLRRRKRVRRR